MRQFLSLSSITVKGLVRERTFHVLLLLAFGLFFVTPFLSAIAPRQGIQVALDFVMSIVSFVGLILAIFIGSGLISKDVDSKTIYSVITKPLSRSNYIFGRFLGMTFVLLGSMLLLTAFGLLSFYITVNFFNPLGDKPSWFLFGVNFFFTLEMLLIVVSAAFLVSSVSTSTFLPLAVTITFYYVGQSIAKVKALLESWQGKEFNPVFKAVVNVAYYVFPNLALFNLKAKAAYNLAVADKELLYVFSYGIIYIAIMLILTINIFNKRDIA